MILNKLTKTQTFIERDAKRVKKANREQLKLVKFMLSSYVSKLSSKQKATREIKAAKINYKQRKNLIIGIHMYLKTILRLLNNPFVQGSFKEILLSENDMLTRLETVMRTKLLINMESLKA